MPLVAPAMAVPPRNHWLPVVLLDVSTSVSVCPPLNVIVGLAGLMQKVWFTAGAALNEALPAWLAVIVTLPALVMVTCAPARVTLSDVDENETASPELAVAVRLNGASPNVLAAKAAKVIVCPAILTVSVCCTSAAARKLLFPLWLAVMVVAPAFKIVTVLPLMDATVASLLAYETASPEVEVAVKLNGASPNVFAARALKVIVWAA